MWPAIGGLPWERFSDNQHESGSAGEFVCSTRNCDSIAPSKQYPAITGHQRRPGEIACLGEPTEIFAKVLGDLVVPRGLTRRHRLKQNHAGNLQTAKNRFT